MNKQQVTFEDFQSTKSGMLYLDANDKEATITNHQSGGYNLCLRKKHYVTMMRYYDFITAAELAVEFING